MALILAVITGREGHAALGEEGGEHEKEKGGGRDARALMRGGPQSPHRRTQLRPG